MDDLKNQVARAQRSLTLQLFVELLPWCICGCLAIAVAAVAATKFWFIDVDKSVWFWSWFGGAIGGGILLALAIAWFRRRGEMEAALEIDRRFGLKERVSSALALSDKELQSEAGQAVVDDASRSVSKRDVTEKFPIAGSWWGLMPFVPAAAVFLLMVFTDAQPEVAQAGQQEVTVKKNIKKQTEELKKKISEKAKKAEEKGLPEAKDLFERIEKGLDKSMDEAKADPKKALAGLTDLAKEIKERQQKLGGQEQIKEQLAGMKEMKQGPADKVGDALKQGDFQKAIDEIKKLKENLENGQLDAAKQKELADQLEQMQQKLQQAADAHEQQKRDLQKEINEKEKAGDREGAAQAQQKLDKLKQKDGAMQQASKLAQKLGQACENCKQGAGKDAAQQLGDAAKALQEMQDADAELQDLNEALDDIADAKQQMACKECQGAGCKKCQGGGEKPGQGPGDAGGKDGDNNPDGDPNQRGGKGGLKAGRGRGMGEKDNPEDKAKLYDSQVAAKVNKGGGVSAGTTGGPNAKGNVKAEISESFSSGQHESESSLTDKPIPKSVREHAKEYLDKVRTGE